MELKLSANTRDVEKIFTNLVKGFNDFRPPLKETSRFQLKEIDEAYKVSGKNITGTSWPKLKPSTLKAKIKSGFLTNILVRTGKMRKSHKQSKLTRDTLEIDNKTRYFETHQKGIGKVPQRQVHGHSDNMVKEVIKIFQNYLLGLIKKF